MPNIDSVFDLGFNEERESHGHQIILFGIHTAEVNCVINYHDKLPPKPKMNKCLCSFIHIVCIYYYLNIIGCSCDFQLSCYLKHLFPPPTKKTNSSEKIKHCRIWNSSVPISNHKQSSSLKKKLKVKTRTVRITAYFCVSECSQKEFFPINVSAGNIFIKV